MVKNKEKFEFNTCVLYLLYVLLAVMVILDKDIIDIVYFGLMSILLGKLHFIRRKKKSTKK